VQNEYARRAAELQFTTSSAVKKKPAVPDEHRSGTFAAYDIGIRKL
jgi:hypothetical protein